jgi:hypothetical protein
MNKCLTLHDRTSLLVARFMLGNALGESGKIDCRHRCNLGRLACCASSTGIEI